MKLFKRTATDKATGEVKEISGKWWYRFEYDRKTYTASTRLANHKEALKVATAKRNEAVLRAAGLVVDPKTVKTVPTLSGFDTTFLNHLVPRVSKRTWRYYVDAWRHISNHPPLYEARLCDVTSALVDGFVQSKLSAKPPLAAVTINHSIQTLRRCLHVAEDLGVITKAPKLKLLPEGRPRDYVISEAVLSKFMALCEPRDPSRDWRLPRIQMDVDMRPLLVVLFDSGMRIGEAVRLEWSDVSLEGQGRIHIRYGKTKNARRFIPLTVRAKAVLEELKKVAPPDVAAVFVHNGRSITITWASHNFTWARRKLKLPDTCTLHSLRHSFLTRLGGTGTDSFTLMKIAGHATVQQSSKYIHMDDEMAGMMMARLSGQPQQ